MYDRIRSAFDAIHAEPALKDQVKNDVLQRIRQRQARQRRVRAVAVAACLLLISIVGGGWIYLTPTAKISIDINPSIELGVNRFDRVVSAEGLNEDGDKVLESLSLRFMDYDEEVAEILESESVSTLLSQDEVLTIGVTGEKNEQCERMLSCLSSCTEREENAHCYYADEGAMETAREVGLSYGQYRAFLELQAFDPEVTPEDVKGMSVREIREWIADLSDVGDTSENQGHGQGHHYGQNGKNS